MTIIGIIDHLHLIEDRVEIGDFKTDLDRSAETEYRKQLSINYHVVVGIYSDRGVKIEGSLRRLGEWVTRLA